MSVKEKGQFPSSVLYLSGQECHFFQAQIPSFDILDSYRLKIAPNQRNFHNDQIVA